MDNEPKVPAGSGHTPARRQPRGPNAGAARKEDPELPDDYAQWLDKRMFDPDDDDDEQPGADA